VDLVQQWADFAARAQEADFGKLAPEVSREESAPVGVPMSRLLHVSDGAVSLAAMLEMDEKCEMSLGGGGQVVNQASPGAASARIAELMRQGNLGLLMDVELDVRLQFGCRQTTLRDVLELATGAVLELDREIQEPVDLLLNGRVIARGEVVVVDGNYGLRVTEVATAQQRVDSL
jgi:flagellar motor switch protein FliN/FliY